MDVILTLAIGFVTAFLVFISTEIDVRDGKKLVKQLSTINAIVLIVPFCAQMLYVYFTNPSGLTDWSNGYVNAIVMEFPEELVGEIGGAIFAILIPYIQTLIQNASSNHS